jgi:hypothetical protein
VCDSMKLVVLFTGGVCRGVINEVQCGFFWIYAPTPYSTVFLLHTHLHLHLHLLRSVLVRFGVVRCRCGLAVWAGFI